MSLRKIAEEEIGNENSCHRAPKFPPAIHSQLRNKSWLPSLLTSEQQALPLAHGKLAPVDGCGCWRRLNNDQIGTFIPVAG